MQRSAGMLLPLFSLPGPYGIGSLGAQARHFADFLRQAGQSWWQILPVGPTGAGDSPYTSVSTFAGNPLLIDLDLLAADGLLDESDLKAAQVPLAPIDYAALQQSREPLLRKAYRRGYARDAQAVQTFVAQHLWVKEYALYRAIKTQFGEQSWPNWPQEALRRHDPVATQQAQVQLADEIQFHTYVQCLFFAQWQAFKTYVNAQGVQLIGDLPIYVSLDSADVWSERREFLLGQNDLPSQVSGVPPDYFSADGQLWGNPLYDWNQQKSDGFGWWIRRVEGAGGLVDAIRIDHFRGLESYWAIPADAKTAQSGVWEQGPGMALLGTLTSWFPKISFIAEDLGILTDAVHTLREAAKLPGMKVLEFAFSGPDNAYLPHHYPKNCVCYTGTHDNDTALGWYTHATPEERAFAAQYLGVTEPEAVCQALLRQGQGSVADLFVAQVQDYLQLGSEARINVPGTPQGNWRWRLNAEQLTPALEEKIKKQTAATSRC